MPVRIKNFCGGLPLYTFSYVSQKLAAVSDLDNGILDMQKPRP
jgi:hypothetical protein